MGEHAVLQGKPALVAAINQYIHIVLKPRKDRIIRIDSQLGILEISLDVDVIEISPPFQFVLCSIRHYHSLLPSGFDLKIESEFSEKIGFGSSAAVVVGTLKVLDAFCSLKVTHKLSTFERFQMAKGIVQEIQGQASGADVAASVYGGLIFYHPKSNTDISIEPLKAIEDEFPNIIALYSGKKVPTPEVIAMVQAKYQKYPDVYDEIFTAIALCTVRARQALLTKDWKQFGELMNIHHGLQVAMGLSNPTLESLVYQLRNMTGIWGSKISGAGLGDCVIGLSSRMKLEHGMRLEHGMKLGHEMGLSIENIGNTGNIENIGKTQELIFLELAKAWDGVALDDAASNDAKARDDARERECLP